jgi:hypothetical protein
VHFSLKIAPKPAFSVVESHHVGESEGEKFSTGIDSKGVINNLQYFMGNLYPLGV